MSDFATAFKELVVPNLRRSCRLQALAIARHRCSFSDGTTAVIRQAIGRGGDKLPSAIFQQLIDWIDTTILKTVCAIENDETAARRIVEDAVPIAIPGNEMRRAA